MAFKFLIQEAFKNIARNKTSFSLSVGVATACFLLLSIFLILTYNVYRAKDYLEDRIEIYAFLDENADVDNLSGSILQIQGVREVQYVSKEQALAELRTDLAENADLLDILSYNPLPASFRIKLESGYKLAEKLAEIEQKLQLLKGIKEVWSGKDLIIKLQKVVRLVIGFDIGILLIVFVSVIFIVSRTVEATIFAKAREIEIMRLVGATNKVIKFPFYIEGFLHGLLGSIFATVISIIIFYFVRSVSPALYLPYNTLTLFNIFWGCVLGIG
ncbi:MAG: ABC transporter permease, partial [candidate division WOR-3 bacterium]|nr:ABC transporter permease [candidate division WOR-3 bacterium]